MALIPSIGAGVFSSFGFLDAPSALQATKGRGARVTAGLTTSDTLSKFEPTSGLAIGAVTYADGTASTAIGAAQYTAIGNIRDFPEIGTPANIVNVPVFGQAVAQQIPAQPNAPVLEFTLNYVPGDAGQAALQSVRNQGNVVTFFMQIKNGATSTDDATFFWNGVVASYLVSPSLDDSNQATVTVTLASPFVGPFPVGSAPA